MESHKIGSIIRAEREQLGLTTQLLADLADVSLPTLLSIEKGRGAQMRKVAAVLRSLGLELSVREIGGPLRD